MTLISPLVLAEPLWIRHVTHGLRSLMPTAIGPLHVLTCRDDNSRHRERNWSLQVRSAPARGVLRWAIQLVTKGGQRTRLSVLYRS